MIVRDSPRNAAGPRCICCGQPYAEDIGGDRIETVCFGGVIALEVCLPCHKCPLGGPCAYDGVKPSCPQCDTGYCGHHGTGVAE